MMKRKLDAARIEEARRTTIKSDTKEAERRQIQETISKNRRGERRSRLFYLIKSPMPIRNLSASEWRLTAE